MESKDPTCFTCGLPAGDLPRLNRLDNGAVCPTCRDRLLEMLPPLFPGGEPGPAVSFEPDAFEELGADEALLPRAMGRPRKDRS